MRWHLKQNPGSLGIFTFWGRDNCVKKLDLSWICCLATWQSPLPRPLPCSIIWQPRCGRAGALPLEGFRSHPAFLVEDHGADSWFSWHMSHLRCSLPKIQHPKSWVLTFQMIDLQNLGNVSNGFGEPKCLLLFWFPANSNAWEWLKLGAADGLSVPPSTPVYYWVWFVGNSELSRHRYLSGLQPRSCWASGPSWNEWTLPHSKLLRSQLSQ